MELNICHLYPDILNLYGDRGNILCMQKRLEWRGIGVTVTGVHFLPSTRYCCLQGWAHLPLFPLLPPNILLKRH